MASFLRAIAAALRSWFRVTRGRRDRLAAPADQADLAARDGGPGSSTAAPAPRLLRVGADGTAGLGQSDEPALLRGTEQGRHPKEDRARVAAAAEARRKTEEEERARLAVEAEARRQAAEAARAAAETEARRKTEEEERARLAAEAEARQQADEAARAAAEAEARRKAEEGERARLAAEAEARRQAEEAERVAAEAEARRKAEEDERARVAAEAEVRRMAEEERARLAAEAEARRQAEEAARAAAEAEARRKAEEEERARLAAEAETRRQAEEAERAAAEAEARRKAEEDERARVAAEAEARHKVEEDERKRVAAEAEARRQAEEAERAAAEAEARRKAEEDERARVAAEAEARHKAEEDERKRVAAEAEARRQAEEAARATAEAEVRRKAEEEERKRVAAEAEARRQAEEAARAAAEAEARRKAEEEERARLAAEAETRRQAEEAERAAAEAEARRKAEEDERARGAAEAEARRKAEEEERKRVAAEAEARRQAEEAARAAAEAEARRKAEEEERARLAAEAEARRQAEEAERAAAEAEARRKAEEDERARGAAEVEARRKAEEEERARVAEVVARRQVEEAARAAVEVDVRRKAEEEEQLRMAAENEGRGQSEAVAGPVPQVGDGWPPAAGEVQPENAEESTEEGTEPTARRALRTRRAPRYRGPAGGPPAPRQPPATTRTAATRTEPVAGGNHVLLVELRVLFERGDSLRVTLLPRRGPGLPDELTVWAPSGTVDLVALQEDWYQDVAPQNLGALLLDGVLWRDEATGQEWLLSGREIFVLTSGTAHRGLVSCPRLVLGREHAVLCTTARLAAVEAELREAGCEGWRTIDDNDGAPRGWVLLRDVLPQHPVPWTDNSDILNVLRPLPQIEIALEGGICLGYASWLAEHPPSIRVYGDPDHTGAVQIDGQNATASADGHYTSPGWDSPGPHQVWCNGATKTYSLVRREPPLQSWVAFSFPTPGARGGRIAICGPLVRAFTDPHADSEEAATSEIIQVPPANPVLLGSVPGQVVVTRPRPDVRGAQCIVSSPFAPVWAIPSQPLHCDKRENRVRLVGEPLPPGEGSGEVTARISRPSIKQWCSAIRDAGRKGLAVEPADPAVAELWRRYRRYARDLWRRLR